MRAFSCLVCLASVVSARVITISEYPNYCRMPSSSVSVAVPGPSSSSSSSSISVDTSGPSSSLSASVPGSSSSTSLDVPGPSSSISSTSTPSLPVTPTAAAGYYNPGVPQLGAVAAPRDTVSELFWTNYAEAIREIAGVQVGGDTAFFVGTQAQKGPLAGSYIPDAYTNQGIYRVANTLLNTSTMFYTPGTGESRGYIEALSK